MHRTHSRVLAVAVLIALTRLAHASAAGVAPAPGIWLIDPSRSEVRFTITKLGFADVTGVFRESEGEIRYDPANPGASTVRWRVKVASVLTDDVTRDESLRQEAYFNAAEHPYLSFVSTAVHRRDAASLDVAGTITIRGITRPLTVVVRPIAGPDGPTFETEFPVNRYDFGVVGGSFLGRLIGRVATVRLVAVTVPAPAVNAPGRR
jgi:polyisoprenoid-binding protein YceI